MPRVEPTFVPITQKLAEAYFEGRPPFGFKGYAAVLEDEVVGVGGVFRWEGLPIAFSQMKDGMRPYKKARAKAARLMDRFISDMGIAVYATVDPNEPTSPGLLAKLGFVPTGEITEHGELLVRRP